MVRAAPTSVYLSVSIDPQERKKIVTSYLFFVQINPGTTSTHPQTRLIEDALKTERAENARLRLAADANSRRGSWDGGGQQSRPPPRRKSTGDGACGQVGGQ